MMNLWKIIKGILLLVVIALLLAFVAVRMPSVQNFVCSKVVSSLSDKIDGDISVGNVYLALFNGVVVKDVCVREANGDTLLFAGKIMANLKHSSITKGSFRFGKVVLEDAQFNMRNVTPDSTNLSVMLASLKKKPATDDEKAKDADKEDDEPFLNSLTVEKLLLRNVSFSKLNPFAEAPENPGSCKIDWKNLDIDKINLDVSDLKYKAGEIDADIRKISLRESRGFDLAELSGNFHMGPKTVVRGRDTVTRQEFRIDGLHIDDNKSDLNLNWLSFEMDDMKGFSDFCHAVDMDGNFRKSRIDSRTLRSFTTFFDGKETVLNLQGRVTGPVSNLNTEKLLISTPSQLTSLDVTARVSNISSDKPLALDVDLRNLKTTASDLGELLHSVSPKMDSKIISKFLPNESITLNAKVKGPLTGFTAKCGLATADCGTVNIDAGCSADGGFGFSGLVHGSGINLGRILSNESMGRISFDADADAKLGSNPSVDLRDLTISEFKFKDYLYHDISASGKLEDGVVTARVSSADCNLNFNALGQYDKQNGADVIKASIDLKNADLHALHFDDREVASVRLAANADLKHTADNVWLGAINVGGLNYSLEDGRHDVGDINLRSYASDSTYAMSLKSSFANARYHGDAPVGRFVNELLDLAVRNELPNVMKPSGMTDCAQGEGHDYDFRLVTSDAKPVLDFFLPQLFVHDNTALTASIRDSKDLSVHLNSDLVAFNDIYVRDLGLTVSNPDSYVNCLVTSSMLQKGTIVAENDDINAVINDNVVHLNYAFDNSTSDTNSAHLELMASFPSPEESDCKLIANILPSDFTLEEVTWNISPATVTYKPKDITIQGFRISNEDQMLSADGTMSASRDDMLKVNLKNFDISMLNRFIKKDLGAGGTLTGSAQMSAVFADDMELMADIKGSDLVMGGNSLGDLDIRSQWNDEKSRMDLYVANTLEGKDPLKVVGYYKPDGGEMDIDVDLADFGLAPIEPFITSLATDVSGGLTGRINLGGKKGAYTIKTRDTRFEDFGFIFDFTRVPYVLNGPFSIDNKSIKFDRVEMRDPYGNKGTLSGGLTHDFFKDIVLNIRISLKNMLGLNTTAADNETFYGKAFVDGSVRVTGSLDKIGVSVNITPSSSSLVHVPLGSSSSERASLLTFVDGGNYGNSAYDSLVTAIRKQEEEKSHSSLTANVRLNANPNMEINLDINREVGDVLRAKGNGQISMVVKDGDFNIKGGYNIEEGSYKFVLMGLASRDFILNSGSTINFTGDIMQSELNLTATYRTKASIATLISDSTSVSNRRTVDCGVDITGKLSNPQLDFNFTFPDLDLLTQTKVNNALSTEDKRLKQFIALLVSGGFLPDEQSGIVNNTTLLFSNASEIMSNQINNIFRQLNIPLDLGFNYQPGENGHDMFDVALSTQLFNNRVTINGNIGNRQYVSGAKSDIVGDVDVDIKLNKSGNLRLNLFSHSADQYSNYLDQTQRNGVGIAYQSEFDNFNELIRNVFWSKARKEQYEIEQRALRMQQFRLFRDSIPSNAPRLNKDSIPQAKPLL